MRKTSSVFAALMLFASSLHAEPELLGTWVAVQRSLGGLGTMLTFLPNGKLESSFGAIVEGWYKIEGDKLIEPPRTVNGKPKVTPYRVTDDMPATLGFHEWEKRKLATPLSSASGGRTHLKTKMRFRSSRATDCGNFADHSRPKRGRTTLRVARSSWRRQHFSGWRRDYLF
jgi:hypothetical protein